MTETSTRPEPIRLTDLADPRFSPEAQAILDATAGFADAVQLDAEVLMTQAAEAVGLDDYGAMDFVPRLELLLWCYQNEAGLSPTGRVAAAGSVAQLLRNRLLLTDLLARHPEIHDVEIRRPMIIAGLPRTGTTHLHNLLAADPALRSLPYWESLEPVPVPGE
ncbi:MAG: sulfotransferase, partial [Acidimicrobiales bacterium]